MNSEDLLEEYSFSVRRLRKQCLESGMSEKEFRQLYFEALQYLDKKKEPRSSKRKFVTRNKIIFISIIFIICFYNYQTIYTCIRCKVPEYIHTGSHILRRLSVPIITIFPSLTAYYYEKCLVRNPFFTVLDLDCWPCNSINNVKVISNPDQPITEHSHAPFIYQTDQPVINIKSLKEIYLTNKNIFDKESMIYSDSTLEELITQDKKEHDKLNIWRFNNMDISRILRQIIPRPKIIPRFGQSPERFLIVDSGRDSFKVPDTDCTFSYILSLHGSRTINLVPAKECKHKCKPVQVELKESYLLWYSWWYWRPVVQPSSSNITFIAHIGSYW